MLKTMNPAPNGYSDVPNHKPKSEGQEVKKHHERKNDADHHKHSSEHVKNKEDDSSNHKRSHSKPKEHSKEGKREHQCGHDKKKKHSSHSDSSKSKDSSNKHSDHSKHSSSVKKDDKHKSSNSNKKEHHNSEGKPKTDDFKENEKVKDSSSKEKSKELKDKRKYTHRDKVHKDKHRGKERKEKHKEKSSSDKSKDKSDQPKEKSDESKDVNHEKHKDKHSEKSKDREHGENSKDEGNSEKQKNKEHGGKHKDEEHSEEHKDKEHSEKHKDKKHGKKHKDKEHSEKHKEKGHSEKHKDNEDSETNKEHIDKHSEKHKDKINEEKVKEENIKGENTEQQENESSPGRLRIKEEISVKEGNIDEPMSEDDMPLSTRLDNESNKREAIDSDDEPLSYRMFNNLPGTVIVLHRLTDEELCKRYPSQSQDIHGSDFESKENIEVLSEKFQGINSSKRENANFRPARKIRKTKCSTCDICKNQQRYFFSPRDRALLQKDILCMSEDDSRSFGDGVKPRKKTKRYRRHEPDFEWKPNGPKKKLTRNTRLRGRVRVIESDSSICEEDFKDDENYLDKFYGYGAEITVPLNSISFTADSNNNELKIMPDENYSSMCQGKPRQVSESQSPSLNIDTSSIDPVSDIIKDTEKENKECKLKSSKTFKFSHGTCSSDFSKTENKRRKKPRKQSRPVKFKRCRRYEPDFEWKPYAPKKRLTRTRKFRSRICITESDSSNSEKDFKDNDEDYLDKFHGNCEKNTYSNAVPSNDTSFIVDSSKNDLKITLDEKYSLTRHNSSQVSGLKSPLSDVKETSIDMVSEIIKHTDDQHKKCKLKSSKPVKQHKHETQKNDFCKREKNGRKRPRMPSKPNKIVASVLKEMVNEVSLKFQNFSEREEMEFMKTCKWCSTPFQTNKFSEDKCVSCASLDNDEVKKSKKIFNRFEIRCFKEDKGKKINSTTPRDLKNASQNEKQRLIYSEKSEGYTSSKSFHHNKSFTNPKDTAVKSDCNVNLKISQNKKQNKLSPVKHMKTCNKYTTPFQSNMSSDDKFVACTYLDNEEVKKSMTLNTLKVKSSKEEKGKKENSTVSRDTKKNSVNKKQRLIYSEMSDANISCKSFNQCKSLITSKNTVGKCDCNVNLETSENKHSLKDNIISTKLKRKDIESDVNINRAKYYEIQSEPYLQIKPNIPGIVKKHENKKFDEINSNTIYEENVQNKSHVLFKKSREGLFKRNFLDEDHDPDEESKFDGKMLHSQVSKMGTSSKQENNIKKLNANGKDITGNLTKNNQLDSHEKEKSARSNNDKQKEQQSLDSNMSNNLLNDEDKTPQTSFSVTQSANVLLDAISILASTDFEKNPQNVLDTLIQKRTLILRNEKKNIPENVDQISSSRYEIASLNIAKILLNTHGTFEKVSDFFLKKGDIVNKINIKNEPNENEPNPTPLTFLQRTPLYGSFSKISRSIEIPPINKTTQDFLATTSIVQTPFNHTEKKKSQISAIKDVKMNNDDLAQYCAFTGGKSVRHYPVEHIAALNDVATSASITPSSTDRNDSPRIEFNESTSSGNGFRTSDMPKSAAFQPEGTTELINIKKERSETPTLPSAQYSYIQNITKPQIHNQVPVIPSMSAFKDNQNFLHNFELHHPVSNSNPAYVNEMNYGVHTGGTFENREAANNAPNYSDMYIHAASKPQMQITSTSTTAELRRKQQMLHRQLTYNQSRLGHYSRQPFDWSNNCSATTTQAERNLLLMNKSSDPFYVPNKKNLYYEPSAQMINLPNYYGPNMIAPHSRAAQAQQAEFVLSQQVACVVCNKQATMICSRCARVVYCNEACAKIYWRQKHNMECIPIALQ